MRAQASVCVCMLTDHSIISHVFRTEFVSCDLAMNRIFGNFRQTKRHRSDVWKINVGIEAKC